MRDERTLAVDALAQTAIDDPSVYEDELFAIAANLEREERLLGLAEAFAGWKLGVVAVTDRRVLFSWSGLIRSDLREIKHDDITYADARTDGGSGTLVVATGGELRKFDTIEPAWRAGELADAIRSRLRRFG